MRISTKGRFAVNALIDLARHQHAGPVALATVAKRQQVSLSYLEQLFARLKRDGVVASTRGPGGGYTLAKASGAITIADVVGAVEDAPDAAELAADGASSALWQRLNRELMAVMATITLDTLLADQPPLPATVAPRRPVLQRALAPLALPKPLKPAVPNSVFALARAFTRS